MKVSIVDTSPIVAGPTAVEVLRTTQELAELTDRAGYSRYLLSELHGVPTNAGTAVVSHSSAEPTIRRSARNN